MYENEDIILGKLKSTETSLGEKANQSDVTASLALKANTTDVNASLGSKANQSYVDSKFGSMGNTKTFKGSCTSAELTAKTGMVVDDYWYVTDLSTNKCYNGTAWIDIGNSLNVGDGTITNTKIASGSVDYAEIGKTVLNAYDLASVTGYMINGYDGSGNITKSASAYTVITGYIPIKGKYIVVGTNVSSITSYGTQGIIFCDKDNKAIANCAWSTITSKGIAYITDYASGYYTIDVAQLLSLVPLAKYAVFVLKTGYANYINISTDSPNLTKIADSNKYIIKGLSVASDNIGSKAITNDKVSDKAIKYNNIDGISVSNLLNPLMITPLKKITGYSGGAVITAENANMSYYSDLDVRNCSKIAICYSSIEGQAFIIADTNKSYYHNVNSTDLATAPFITMSANYYIVDLDMLRITYPDISYIAFVFKNTITSPFVYDSDAIPSSFIPYGIKKLNWLGISSSDIVTYWKNKKICTYGDSNTYNKMWQQYILDYFGMAFLYNRGACGSSYVDKTYTNKIWIYTNPTDLSEISYIQNPTGSDVMPGDGSVTEISNQYCADARIATIPTDSDIVLVNGGTNDLSFGNSLVIGTTATPYDTTTLKGAMASCLSKIRNRVPNAQIIVMSPIWNNAEHGDVFWSVIDAEKEVAREFGYPYIDLASNGGINSLNYLTYLTDGTHLNAAGGKNIARFPISKMKEIEPLN